MHSIEEVLVEIEHLKEDVKESILDFKEHIKIEDGQFLKIEKQHLDLIGVIGRLTTAIETYGGQTTLSIKYLKIIGVGLFIGIGFALTFMFYRQNDLIMHNEALERKLQHEIDKDHYYDSNRKVIYQMIEEYKLKIKG